MSRPQIALEGLDGSGKTTLGYALSSALNMKFVEFPSRGIDKSLEPSEYNLACFEDRLGFRSREDFIAGRWSASGIAYSVAREQPGKTRQELYYEACARENNIPVALLTVYLNTADSVRLERLNERRVANKLDEVFEIPEVQLFAGQAYLKLFSQSGLASSNHARGNIIFVSGVDLAGDVARVIAEYKKITTPPA